MAMKPVFDVKLFRPDDSGNVSDAERKRSQMALLWMMEALCQINQGLIRDAKKRGKPYPFLYESGIYYRREPPAVSTFEQAADLTKEGQDYVDSDHGVLQKGPEFWQDIATTTQRGYGDCEDLACCRIAELREVLKRQAAPFVTFRLVDGSFRFHALLAVKGPDGWRMEDPSRKLGMGWEKRFSKTPLKTRLAHIAKIDAIQKQVSPEKFVRLHKVNV